VRACVHASAAAVGGAQAAAIQDNSPAALAAAWAAGRVAILFTNRTNGRHGSGGDYTSVHDGRTGHDEQDEA
jgi:hypothetical protein